MLLRLYKENINILASFFLGELTFLILINQFFPFLITNYFIYIIIINLMFVAYVPVIGYFKLRYETEKELPFFIAFLYSISSVSSSRKRLFEIASEAKEFGYITKIMNKILELANKFRFGYAEAVRYVQRVVPFGNFKSFLDRFSSALEVGEDLTEFLDREYKISMDNYEIAYKKSLENIRVLQDMTVAFVSSLAFALVVVLLIPFLIGIDVVILLGYFILIFFSANLLIILLSRYLILEDSLLHNLPEKPKEYKNILLLFSLFTLISVIIILLFSNTGLPLLAKIAIAITPLSYVSYRVLLFEREIKKKEEQFPMFLSALSGLSEVMGTSQVKVIDSLRIHDFKELNIHIQNLYKRMLLSYDYIKSWFFFAAEIGSKLIAKSVLIFSRAIELGGDPKKVGDKISDLFSRVLDLRKIKIQFLSHARGMLYGGYIAFVAILYVSLEILKMLQSLFEGISTLVGAEIYGTLGLPFFTLAIDMEFLRLIIDIMVISQAFVIALVIKNVDGGSKLGIFLDLSILLWLAAFLSLGIGGAFARFFAIPTF